MGKHNLCKSKKVNKFDRNQNPLTCCFSRLQIYGILYLNQKSWHKSIANEIKYFKSQFIASEQ